MNKYRQLTSHLPTLYQPDEQDVNLLNLILKEVGRIMDEIGRDQTDIMQSHWFSIADKAPYDAHFLRGRELAGKPALNFKNEADQRAISEYPYLLDLARIGALIPVPPWREPIGLREAVETYRKRLLRIIQIYRNGLGTLNAVRNIVTAELPENPDLSLPAQQRSFSVEENIPYVGNIQSIQSIGLPLEELGPLMRWSLSNSGMQSVAPVIFIEGIAATDEFDATVDPVIERFNPTGTLNSDNHLYAIGLAYSGTVSPGETLKLEPAYQAYLTGENGLQHSSIGQTQVSLRSWQPVSDVPSGVITSLIQSTDNMLWCAIDNAEIHQLWRYNGSEWLQVLTAETLPSIHCLYQRGQELLIGTSAGLLSMPLFPITESAYTMSSIAAYAAKPVYVLAPVFNSPMDLYIGSENGLDVLGTDNEIIKSVLHSTAIRAVIESDTTLYFGGGLGLFQYKPQGQQYYYLTAEFESELQEDWVSFEAEILPLTEQFGLPQVTSLLIGDDDSLWIGTSFGLARYRARHEVDLVYRNLLEGFSDLVDGSVTQMEKDEHGYIWFATNRGLLRFDGRDLAGFNFVDDVWTQLGQADQRYVAKDGFETSEKRGVWRFNRNLTQWERFNYTAVRWESFSESVLLDESSVTGIIFIDRVRGELGTLSENLFTKSGDVDPSQLITRCKPQQTRIATGGIAAIPRIPNGSSSWRYLSLEPEGLVDSKDLPWWSQEGRLVLPPDHDAPYPGRFHTLNQLSYQLNQMVFAYNPAAKIQFQWASKKPLRLLVRILKRDSQDVIDPAIIDRVWKGITKVKPAGVTVQLAVDETIVRGEVS